MYISPAFLSQLRTELSRTANTLVQISISMAIEDEIRNHKSFTPSRLRSLYNDFSKLKLLNPEGYDANIYAWSSLLQTLARKNYFGLFSFSVYEPSLEDLLSLPEYGKPRSLGDVLQAMLDTETIVPVSQFVSHQTKFSLKKDVSSSLSPRVLLSWIMKLAGFGQFKSVDTKSKLVSERYIIWNQLVVMGSNILRHLQEKMDKGVYSDCLYTGRLLRQHILESLGKDISTVELGILLVYWSRDQRVCLFERPANELADDLDAAVVKFRPEQITSEDIAIANLRDNASKVAKREIYLHEKIESTKGSIKVLLQQQVKTNEDTTRQRIKSLLSTKRLLTKAFTETSELSIQLSTILSKIDDSSNNIATYQLLSQSSKALTSMQSKIDIDQVLDLKEDIQEQIQTTDEITNALSAPQNASDDEIELELQEMEREAQQNEVDEKANAQLTADPANALQLPAEPAKPAPEPLAKENDVTSKMENLQLFDNEKSKQNEEPLLA